VHNLDKAVHALMYFTLSFSWLKTLKKANYQKTSCFYKVLLLIVIYGIIIEVLQEVVTPNRHGELNDVLANIVGIGIAAIVFKKSIK
jgi:VanZ family protein